MRNGLPVRILVWLAITAGIFAHIARAQDVLNGQVEENVPSDQSDQGDVFSSGADSWPDQTQQTPDSGDVFSSGASDGSDQQGLPVNLGDIFSSGTDSGSDQDGGTPDTMPANPFFGMEFRLLAQAAELEAQTPQSGLPLPRDVRSQLLQAAAQLDNSATQAQTYSLAATDRFFKCMGEAVDADLRFLAQPGYVPAAQIAKSLHQGLWRYLTSNAYGNNLAMYEGAVRSMQHAMNDPACAFGQAAPGIVAVAVTRTAGAMAEARQVSAAANAAIVLEEEAATNGYAKWYVPGLRCPGCLVYGTAEGDYANFARTVGGRTINSIPKPVSLSWQQFSKQALDGALQTKTPVLFSLQGMEQIDQVLAGQAYKNAVTSFELRYIQQNWSQFKSIVRFFNNGQEVAAPWE
jgi:hypothetical protein